jgi:hypothetical protein
MMNSRFCVRSPDVAAAKVETDNTLRLFLFQYHHSDLRDVIS